MVPTAPSLHRMLAAWSRTRLNEYNGTSSRMSAAAETVGHLFLEWRFWADLELEIEIVIEFFFFNKH